MKIFISGKITGDPDYREKFAQAEREIINKGHMVMNPAILPVGFSHAEYMKITLAMQSVCDATYMMPGWEESEGAKAEGIEATQIIYDLADIPDITDCCKWKYYRNGEWIAGCDVEFEPIDLSPGMIDFFKFCPICGKRIVRVQDLESKIAGFIEVSDTDGKDDKQIYQMVKAWMDKEAGK